MSTRANIVITDNDDKLFFYKHSDGYPEGTLPTLERFLKHVKNGEIRDNVCQASGWLIIFGNTEYEQGSEPTRESSGWKVGAYEPTIGIHGDIEYLYHVDLVEEKITVVTENFKKFDRKCADKEKY